VQGAVILLAVGASMRKRRGLRLPARALAGDA